MAETSINIPYPAAEDPHLRIALGACRFMARPGGGQEWVAETTTTRLAEDLSGSSRKRRAPRSPRRSPPSNGFRLPSGACPATSSSSARRRPFALTIETGASDFDLDLGGVPLNRLVVKQGAGKFELDFTEPNPEPMELLDFSPAAAAIELENLANANFSEMRLSGGAASYDLDFGGTLSRDAEVSIETGISGVEVSVPALHRREGVRRDHPGQRGRG